LIFLAFDDANRDADLMADSLIERRDRFICITRAWPLTDMRTLGGDCARVLEDIKLINERDNPPANYSTLSYTAKRLICVKMVERQAGTKCICDIIFLYRSKRPPQFYTLIGDINGLQMCVREGSVPPFRAPPAAPQTQSNLYPNPLADPSHHRSQQQQQHQSYPTSDYSNTNTLTKKSDEKEILDCIPFEINPKYLTGMSNNRNKNDLSGLDTFRILSVYEIDQYFNYDFNIERSSL
jgi:ESCRT-I complex subunit MVB12